MLFLCSLFIINSIAHSALALPALSKTSKIFANFFALPYGTPKNERLFAMYGFCQPAPLLRSLEKMSAASVDGAADTVVIAQQLFVLFFCWCVCLSGKSHWHTRNRVATSSCNDVEVTHVELMLLPLKIYPLRRCRLLLRCCCCCYSYSCSVVSLSSCSRAAA